MDKWYKLETNKALNPCVCGSDRRAYFRKGETVYVKCVKCLMTASGKSEEEAEAEWNRITEGVRKVDEGRKEQDSKSAKTGGRSTKKSVPGKSVSRGNRTGA